MKVYTFDEDYKKLSKPGKAIVGTAIAGSTILIGTGIFAGIRKYLKYRKKTITRAAGAFY